MSDRDLVELELHTPETHQRWRAERDGAVVTTTSGPADGKQRTARKDHGTSDKARKSLATAVRKREKEGYFPADGSWPLPVDCEPGEGLRVVAVPGDREGRSKVRDTIPAPLEVLVVGQRTFRACGAEEAWRAAEAEPVVGRDHVIGLAPLHDTIAAVALGKVRVDDVRERLAQTPQLLEVRAYQEGWTPLGYAAWRGLDEVAPRWWRWARTSTRSAARGGRRWRRRWSAATTDWRSGCSGWARRPRWPPRWTWTGARWPSSRRSWRRRAPGSTTWRC
ncbi:MAG: hypothetical protein R3F59_02850 [Myxococcota bacterium]